MPINEAKRKTRERWPLAFDLEGIPRDSTLRQQLLEQQKNPETFEQEQPVRAENQFAVDYQQTENVVDINNPPVARYGTPKNPFRQFPQMVYDHGTGRVLEVKNAAQLEAATKRGFEEKPSPHHDYHKVKSGMIAPIKEKGPEREKVMTAEELEELEAQELAALEEEQQEPQQSAEDADAEVAAALGEPVKPKGKGRRK